MSHSGTRITGPTVQILGDLQPVLGTSKTGLGDIIANADIRKWAKYKPFQNPNSAFASAEDREKARKGILVAYDYNRYGKYGIKIPAFGFDTATAGNWTYARPSGVIGVQPFRLLDFLNYDHSENTPPLYFNFETELIYTTVSGKNNYSASVGVNTPDSYGLSYEDVTTKTFNNHYLIFAFYKPSNSKWYFVRSSETIQESLTSTHGGLLGHIGVDTYNVAQALSLSNNDSIKVFAFVGQMANATDTQGSNITDTESLEYTDAGQTAVSFKTITAKYQETAWYTGLEGAVAFSLQTVQTTSTEKQYRIGSFSALHFHGTSEFVPKYIYYRTRLIATNGGLIEVSGTRQASVVTAYVQGGVSVPKNGNSAELSVLNLSSYLFHIPTSGQNHSIQVQLLAYQDQTTAASDDYGSSGKVIQTGQITV